MSVRASGRFADVVGLPLSYNPQSYSFWYQLKDQYFRALVSTQGYPGQNGGNGQNGLQGANGTNGTGLDNTYMEYIGTNSTFTAPKTGTYQVNYAAEVSISPAVFPQALGNAGTGDITLSLNLTDLNNVSTPVPGSQTMAGGYDSATNVNLISSNEIYIQAGYKLAVLESVTGPGSLSVASFIMSVIYKNP